MSLAVCLLVYATLVSVVVPRALPRLTHRGGAPAAAVGVWLLALTSVLASWFIAATVLTAHTVHAWGQPVASPIGTCVVTLHAALVGTHGPVAQIGTLLMAVIVATFVSLLGIRVVRKLARGRTGSLHHAESALIVGRRVEGVDGVVVDAPQKAAYCIAGRPGTVVITSAAVEALDKPLLDAVLAHEHAHLTGRHHLLLAITRALASCLPRVRLFTLAEVEVARLLEMCADDRAANQHGHETVLDALLTLAAPAPIPRNALGASTVGVTARLSRLADPQTDTERASERVQLALFGAAVIAAPLVVELLARYGCIPFSA